MNHFVQFFAVIILKQNDAVLSFLGPIGPLELGLSVGRSVVLVENVHWGPLDDSRIWNGEWGMGNGEWGIWNGEYGMGNGE